MKSRSFSISNIVACVVSMLIFVLSMSFSFDVNAASTSRTYKKYNAVTNAYLGSYTLQALSTTNNSVSPYVYIGSDDRVVDFTKSGVVKLMSSEAEAGYIGTGFVVDAHTIATAAHCVYNISITSIKLFDSNGNVSKTVVPVEAHIPQKYINDAQDSVDYDYALLTVNEDLSDYAIFDLGVALDTAITNNISISVTGFPNKVNNNEVNNSTNHAMYTGSGVLSYNNDFNATINGKSKTFYKDKALFYTADSSGGNSGGPLYFTKSYCGNVYYTVIGIHNYGFGSISKNSATRMTPDLLHFYMSNPNI